MVFVLFAFPSPKLNDLDQKAELQTFPVFSIVKGAREAAP
jgi:hypothetical protein